MTRPSSSHPWRYDWRAYDAKRRAQVWLGNATAYAKWRLRTPLSDAQVAAGVAHPKYRPVAGCPCRTCSEGRARRAELARVRRARQ